MNSRVDQNYGGFINIPPVGQMQSSTQGYGLSTGYNVLFHILLYRRHHRIFKAFTPALRPRMMERKKSLFS